jgi:hypothetical protein
VLGSLVNRRRRVLINTWQNIVDEWNLVGNSPLGVHAVPLFSLSLSSSHNNWTTKWIHLTIVIIFYCLIVCKRLFMFGQKIVHCTILTKDRKWPFSDNSVQVLANFNWNFML